MRTIKLTNGVTFNSEHYAKVRRAREAANLPTYKEFMESEGRLKHGKIPNHPLLGKRFKLTHEDGSHTIYVMENVCQHYYDGGFYLAAAPRQEGTQSHGNIYFENVNSTNPFILEIIEEFKANVEWL